MQHLVLGDLIRELQRSLLLLLTELLVHARVAQRRKGLDGLVHEEVQQGPHHLHLAPEGRWQLLEVGLQERHLQNVGLQAAVPIALSHKVLHGGEVVTDAVRGPDSLLVLLVLPLGAVVAGLLIRLLAHGLGAGDGAVQRLLVELHRQERLIKVLHHRRLQRVPGLHELLVSHVRGAPGRKHQVVEHDDADRDHRANDAVVACHLVQVVLAVSRGRRATEHHLAAEGGQEAANARELSRVVTDEQGREGIDEETGRQCRHGPPL
mmetsp:Transcript_35006/g.89937  ORF Transcript_35006/g.89937 Transcript_35006/m.89937 type:complete len:264 (+) Transcript_35006:491-1282(+)